MATTIQIKRGLAANVAATTLVIAEPAFTTDTGKLYIYDGTTKVLINPLTDTQASSITTQLGGLGTASTANTGTLAGQLPLLDAGGKLPSSVIPASAITETFVVSSQSAMLALTAQTGDVAVRTDLSQTFILQAEPASTLANWVLLLTPTDAVSSVNGLTGTVVITAGNSALQLTGYVAPAGTALQTLAATDTVLAAITKLQNNSQYNVTTLNTALGLKAPLASPAFTGTPTTPTPTAGDNTTSIATTAFVSTALSNYSSSNPGNFVKTVNTISPVSGALTLGGANISITGYTAASSYSAPVATDSVNVAIGKLQYGVEHVDGGTF